MKIELPTSGTTRPSEEPVGRVNVLNVGQRKRNKMKYFIRIFLVLLILSSTLLVNADEKSSIVGSWEEESESHNWKFELIFDANGSFHCKSTLKLHEALTVRIGKTKVRNNEFEGTYEATDKAIVLNFKPSDTSYDADDIAENYLGAIRKRDRDGIFTGSLKYKLDKNRLSLSLPSGVTSSILVKKRNKRPVLDVKQK